MFVEEIINMMIWIFELGWQRHLGKLDFFIVEGN